MKILFLEDRPSRQLIFLPNKEDDINAINELIGIYMPQSNKCREIINEINQGEYSFHKELVLIIIHKSSINTKGLDYLNKFCETKGVKLVCFSGGISQLLYTKEKYEFLNINSTDFYTERLIPFLKSTLDNKMESLLELVNDNWQLSYMLLARQLIYSLDIETNEDSKFIFQEKIDSIAAILTLDFSIEKGNLKDLNTEINKIILLS